MRKNLPLVILLSFIVLACETTSGVLSLGPDTYTLSTSSEFGIPRAKKMALTEANQYCVNQEKNMLVTNTSEGVKPDFMGDLIGHYDVTFRCLNGDDSELVRPTYVKE